MNKHFEGCPLINNVNEWIICCYVLNVLYVHWLNSIHAIFGATIILYTQIFGASITRAWWCTHVNGMQTRGCAIISNALKIGTLLVTWWTSGHKYLYLLLLITRWWTLCHLENPLLNIRTYVLLNVVTYVIRDYLFNCGVQIKLSFSCLIVHVGLLYIFIILYAIY